MLPRLFPTAADWLTALLRASVRNGHTPNVVLAADGGVPSIGLGDGEWAVALVRTTDGREIVLTSDRVVEHGRTVLRYGQIARCHWITDHPDVGECARLKQTHFHRLIFDLEDGRKMVLEQLDQAVFPLLKFFGSLPTKTPESPVMQPPGGRPMLKRSGLTPAVVWEAITRFVVSPLLILGGLWFIALPFGFAKIRFGGRADPPDWGEYLGEVFASGASPIGMGLVLMIGGVYLAATRRSRPDRGETTKSL